MRFHLLHGKPLEKIKRIIGTHNFRGYILEITHVPTRKRGYGVGVIKFKNKFPDELWSQTTLALEREILAFFYKQAKKRINWMEFQRPTSALIPRSGISFSHDRSRIELMFHFKIPRKGNKINGRALANAFEKEIPKMINSILSDKEKHKAILEAKKSLIDQMEIKRFLSENGYLAFIGNGVEINGKRIKVEKPDRIRVPTSGKVYGLLIPDGRTALKLGLEAVEMLAKGYAYYKPGTRFELVKTINDLAWINKGEEWLANYSGMNAVMGVEELDFPRGIFLECQDFDYLVKMEDELVKRERVGKCEKKELPRPEPVVLKKRLPKAKLELDGILVGNTKYYLPFNYSATLVERNQLRAIVDAINFSQKYVNGKLDIKEILSRTIRVINKKGLSILGLGFYSEFTRWQIFYLMYKLHKAMGGE